MKRSLQLLAAGTLAAAVAAPAVAHEAGTWVLRGGVGALQPKSNSLSLESTDVGGGVTVDSANVEFDSATSVALSGSYMFTPNWALDVMLAWAFQHDIDIAATISDGVTTESVKLPFGEVELFPPTVSVQYHFTPDGRFQPYVGLGVNYSTFGDEKVRDEFVAEGVSAVKFDDSVGVAAQLGADWVFGADHTWLLNVDVRWMDIEADMSLTLDDGTGPVTGELGTADIDP